VNGAAPWFTGALFVGMTHRLRSVGWLLAFLALFLVLEFVALAMLRSEDLTLNSLVTLSSAVIVGLVLLELEKRPASQLIVLGAWHYRSDGGSLIGWASGGMMLLLYLAVPAAAEEALFRGYPFQKLVAATGPWIASVMASAGFALAHAHNPSVGVFAIANIFCAGLLLSFAFLKTGSLWFATAVHLGWNWMIAGPLDLPVSGLDLYNAPLYEPRALAAPWLTGGNFGPEGGASGLAALLLLAGGVWWYTQRKYTTS
jgi:membrane protease YdiL (CAAX protease family)